LRAVRRTHLNSKPPTEGEHHHDQVRRHRHPPRHATPADADALERLAALDDREPLTGPAMLAEVDGVARVALDLGDGTVAADPFVLTADLVKLLSDHAARQVPRRSWRPRLALARRRPAVHA